MKDNNYNIPSDIVFFGSGCGKDGKEGSEGKEGDDNYCPSGTFNEDSLIGGTAEL